MRAGVLQHAARRGQPVAGEAVIVGEAAELVPVIVDRIHLGLVGAAQLAAQLHVVGRIGEDQIGAAFGQRVHARHAVAFDDLIQFQRCHGPARNINSGIHSDSARVARQESCGIKALIIESPDSSPYKMW